MSVDSDRGLALRAVSYNIHSSIGRDGCKAPERIHDVLASLGGSIVALQEVDSRTDAGLKLDQFDFLAERSGMQSIAGPNILEHRGQYGNALLTNWPIEQTRLIQLAVAGREPRGAIVAVLHCGHRRLQVVNTHLGLARAERREQVDRLLAAIGPFDGPTLFMGDFNVLNRRSALLGRLGAPSGAKFAPRTFPAHRPLFALDRVWVRGRLAEVSVHAVRTKLTSVASDHLPVIAAVRLR
jgi:endonuclease/exonuclease/phosphatase family metal-dependent hydrolase